VTERGVGVGWSGVDWSCSRVGGSTTDGAGQLHNMTSTKGTGDTATRCGMNAKHEGIIMAKEILSGGADSAQVAGKVGG
jgi:hypothetical protein